MSECEYFFQVLYRTVDVAFEVTLGNLNFLKQRFYPLRSVVFKRYLLLLTPIFVPDRPDEIVASDDVEKILWVPIKDVDPEKFAFISIRTMIKNWLEKRKQSVK